MIEKPSHIPARLGFLAGTAADPFLREELLQGIRGHQGVDLAKVVDPLPEEDPRWRVDPIRDLVDDAMHEFAGNRTQADAWLAPRLHASLRMTRREAADRRLWNHIALAVAPDYVVWRHLPNKSEPRTAPERFRGPLDRQCFSRLWWAAEIFRDGNDYSPVVTAFGNQDLVHTVLRSTWIDHRPSAQAVVRLLEAGVVSTGREINGLSVAINAAGATLLYDALAPDVPRDPEPLRQWIEDATTAPPVSRRHLPDGPDEEPVPKESVATLVGHFTDFFETAPVRGRDTEGRV
ncbi:hypothetical protein SRB5_59820 [Streptomyces sp. RB5]|uniref:Uncharacterized protein n=1 Tax=Streptomyces smaragdinus TaxID=2585196 RepID=A0A7K0CQV9_9ACTN|nr:DUF6339 family protein [Streptomyces smaragdinus]MQY15791.1 hypothetical protein [Streptomyces smaragdinus]